MANQYRPALDGLRAAAVIAVFVYHLEYPWLSGGFLGVDLFFVLSGYLITGLLIDEHRRHGRIDLLSFWARRARRLLPAFVLMLAAVAIAIRYWIPIQHWPALRGDALSGLFYFANWHFIGTDQSYFAPPDALSPMRHAWSLAVEEQFYLAWPLLALAALWLARRRRALRLWLVIALGTIVTASALTMIWIYDPASATRAYIGTDARAQQLMIGALLAVAMRTAVQPSTAGRLAARRLAARRLAAPAGICAAAILVTLAVSTNSTQPWYFQGGATLTALVCAILIWSVETKPSAHLSRLLSIWPARAVGKMSYGLYLWHWPVIIFVPLALPALTGARLNLARVAVAFLLATICYLAVENPIRKGRPRIAFGSPPRVAFSSALVILLVAGTTFGATSWGLAGMQAQQLSAAGQPEPCESTVCVRAVGAPGRPVVALIGDSIARSLDPGMVELANRHQWTYVLAARGGCGLTGLLYSTSLQPHKYQVDCVTELPQRIRHTLDTYHPTLVIAASRWEVVGYIDGNQQLVPPGTQAWADTTFTRMRDLAATITSSHATFALVDVLHPASPDRKCMEDPELAGCRRPFDRITSAVNDIYRGIPEAVPGSHVISMQDALCPQQTCPTVIDGRLIRYDGLHFSDSGAKWFVEKLEPQLGLLPV